MPQFKPKNSPEYLTQQQPSQPSETDQRPQESDSPTQSSTAPMASAPELNVVFRVQVAEGVLNVPRKGTAVVLEEILKKYNSDGMTLDTQRGFVWYPTTSIRKVEVEIR
jgi:hypothetical protein